MHPTMREEAFIDASFWIPFMQSGNSRHGEARALWRDKVWQRRRPITTNWTLYEAMTYFNARQRDRHDLALGLLEFARSSTEIVDAARYERRALDVFRSRLDKRWSVVDCANFVCIRERGAGWALSFDRDFAQAQAEFRFTVLR